MSRANILASNKLNADVAGNTGPAPDNTGPAEPTFASEEAPMFEQFFAGGVHPEHIPAAIDRGIEKATDSIRGKLGGLKPSGGSVLTPGPSGGVAAARAVLAGATRRLAAALETPKNPE